MNCLHCLINSSILIKLATAHRRIKRCTALRSLHARFTRATLDKRTESGTNPRYSFGLYSFICSDRSRGLLSLTRHRYTALGDTVKKVVEFTAESITSLSNFVRSIQIRHRILLKLQTSEQTPLMWKPGETLFNKHITTIHHGFNIVRLQEQLVAEMV